MPRTSYGKKWGRVRSVALRDRAKTTRAVEDVVRELKKEQRKLPGEDYRERSLALYGLVCARCGREFDDSKRYLLTVHHKDGDHNNNPLDGSNWENLCVYCHEDVHSRGMLADYLEGTSGPREYGSVHGDPKSATTASSGAGLLGEKLRKALEGKVKE
ncbi:MAG: HNH nuclease family protein [Deltaproteobacteria bacterium]|nr:HNH nuclease family protein [Deltaproteobacteria bacterium]